MGPEPCGVRIVVVVWGPFMNSLEEEGDCAGNPTSFPRPLFPVASSCSELRTHLGPELPGGPAPW